MKCNKGDNLIKSISFCDENMNVLWVYYPEEKNHDSHKPKRVKDTTKQPKASK